MSAGGSRAVLELPAFLDHPKRATSSKARESPRPSLRLVASPSSGVARLPFALVVVGLLAAGLFGLLLVNTLSAQDAFTVSRLRQHSEQLTDRAQQLQSKVADQQSTAALLRRARSLGMVPAGEPTVTRLPGGRSVAAATAPPGSQRSPRSSR